MHCWEILFKDLYFYWDLIKHAVAVMPSLYSFFHEKFSHPYAFIIALLSCFLPGKPFIVIYWIDPFLSNSFPPGRNPHSDWVVTYEFSATSHINFISSPKMFLLPSFWCITDLKVLVILTHDFLLSSKVFLCNWTFFLALFFIVFNTRFFFLSFVHLYF